ncbi:Uncharacterised protein [Zhongshania aliphaticivorans]|uniref:NAD(P)-binding domain-containing protein n=1 Tax=Zhongshania aliphaticivorans TaxID=1470434 RepID=A0A5S9PZL5_9GAMM|nr:NAD(P)H-binding protein [Zhongshania aliphaticivorans]CAA0092611.1 Uncharacterised protein [Zhongshania aliphaticivorans]CAA0109959.1 Uncharacterised protein [Zhongshania aliphaticivorans]
MGKVAIVIGATGVVGRALVDQLVEADHIAKVVTLTRRAVSHPSLKVANHIVNFEELDNHSALFVGDFLFSCLGTTLKQAGSVAAQRSVDLDYQLKAAELAAENGVSHYFLVSSSGANANSHSAYLKMKGELEQKVKALPFTGISIFQPSLLLGARSDVRLGEKIGGFLLPALCAIPGLRRFRPISGEEVAAKMVSESQQLRPLVNVFRLDDIFLDD